MIWLSLEQMIDLIMIWCEENEWAQSNFDPGFINWAHDALKRTDRLMRADEKSVEKIFEKFKIEKWAEENGYL